MELYTSSADLLNLQGRLGFQSPLERAYQDDYNTKLMRIARPGTALAILVYFSFWILDLYTLPSSYQVIWLIRAAGILLMGCLFALSYTNFFKHHVIWIFTSACLLVNLSVIASFAVTKPDEIAYDIYYITLFFVILGAPLLGLPFRSEILVTMITMVVYFWTAVFMQDMLSSTTSTAFLAINSFFFFGATMIGIAGAYFGEINNRRDFLLRLAIDQERARSESLLLNILPAPVADRLKRNEKVADYYESASILFADIVNFTPLSSTLTPSQLVELLNQVFSYFDSLVEKYGVEKIKTIGDCYMAAAGVPTPRPDHASVLTMMALEIQAYVADNSFLDGKKLSFRLGINSGPLVAGIIGSRKFIYDLWGDSVNTASRMESHGADGVIQITRSTYDLIEELFLCEPGGRVLVKGKGEMEVFQVVGQKQIDQRSNSGSNVKTH